MKHPGPANLIRRFRENLKSLAAIPHFSPKAPLSNTNKCLCWLATGASNIFTSKTIEKLSHYYIQTMSTRKCFGGLPFFKSTFQKIETKRAHLFVETLCVGGKAALSELLYTDYHLSRRWTGTVADLLPVRRCALSSCLALFSIA